MVAVDLYHEAQATVEATVEVEGVSIPKYRQEAEEDFVDEDVVDHLSLHPLYSLDSPMVRLSPCYLGIPWLLFISPGI